jgi:hypothetical protein
MNAGWQQGDSDMDNCIKTGAYVYLIDYNLYAPADIFAVGGKRVVQFNGNVEETGLFEPQRTITHILYLNESENYWDKTRGIAVVDESDLIAAASIQNQTTTKESA